MTARRGSLVEALLPLPPLRLAVAAAAALIGADGVAQPALLDRLAGDLEFRLDWDAYRNDEARLAIEICQTNVCDRFVAHRPNLESFTKFIDVYVVFSSGYGDLTSRYRGDDGRSIVPPISYIETRLAEISAADVVTPECGPTLTLEAISCSLNGLADSLDLRKSYVRYDRGRHEVDEPDWRARSLGVERIASRLDYYAGIGLPLTDLSATPD